MPANRRYDGSVKWEISMSPRIDTPRAETTGKVLPFPDSSTGTRTLNAGLKWLALIGGALVAVMLAAAGALWIFHGKGSIQYVTAEVTRGTVARTSTATGTVNPVLTVIVGTYVSGVIQNIYCDYNTRVRAGQVCAKIDPRPYQATFDQYSAQRARDQALLDKDRMNLDRYQRLAAQNAIARQQAEDQAEVVKQDEATIKLDQALVEGALLNLNYTNIVSPVDGTVVSRNVSGGQTVAASFQTPTLFLIATDLKQMEVDTNTSEGDMGRIVVGNSATFTVDAYPGRTFRGTVTQVRQSPNTVQNVVTYAVVIGVNNSDLALIPGMTASTRIIVEERNDVLRVPNQALRFTPRGVAAAGARTASSRPQEVFVLRDSGPVAVPVVVGIDDGTFTEVAGDGLQPGDRVILSEKNRAAKPRPTAPAPRL
jgi:HlyD family secretion protein